MPPLALQPGDLLGDPAYSYLQPRPEAGLPSAGHVHATAELLDYAATEPDLTLWVYTALLEGAYTRTDKPLPPAYDHPGTTRRRALLREVAGELGATPNQVVLRWLMDGEPPMIPIIGVSSVAQLDELLATTTTIFSNDLRLRLQE